MSDTVAIRQAAEGDVEEIAAIHVACWKTAYRGILSAKTLDGLRVEDRAALWRGWLAGPGVHARVAIGGGRIVGFVRLCPARPVASPPRDAAEISHLYVDPAAQARGTGFALLQEALRIAREGRYAAALLWVLEGNAPARRFYERCGLSPDGARRTDPSYLGNDAVEVRYRVSLVAPGD